MHDACIAGHKFNTHQRMTTDKLHRKHTLCRLRWSEPEPTKHGQLFHTVLWASKPNEGLIA